MPGTKFPFQSHFLFIKYTFIAKNISYDRQLPVGQFSQIEKQIKHVHDTIIKKKTFTLKKSLNLYRVAVPDKHLKRKLIF